MSFLDYGSRLQGSLGRYGRDIDTFKAGVYEDKMASIEKLFSPEISDTAQQLTNLQNIKSTVETTLDGTSGSLEALGAAVGVKKLYGAIKEKLGGKSLGDKKEGDEIEDEAGGEGGGEGNSFVKTAEEPELSTEGDSNFSDLFGNVKNVFNDVKSSAGDTMSETMGNLKDAVTGQSSATPQVREIEMKDMSDVGGGEGGGGAGPPNGLKEIEMTDMGEPKDVYTYDQIPTDYKISGDTTGGLLERTDAVRPMPEGMTHEAPTQTETSSSVSGDADDLGSTLAETEAGIEGAEAGAEVAEGAAETVGALGNFLDAIPVVGTILGVGLTIGSTIFGAVEEGKEQSLESQESSEESQEKSAEESARDAIRTNASFTGSTVVPTFSSLTNMGGGQGVF